jgi:hypothetical protein
VFSLITVGFDVLPKKKALSRLRAVPVITAIP